MIVVMIRAAMWIKSVAVVSDALQSNYQLGK
jgi:hypothetical protein